MRAALPLIACLAAACEECFTDEIWEDTNQGLLAVSNRERAALVWWDSTQPGLNHITTITANGELATPRALPSIPTSGALGSRTTVILGTDEQRTQYAAMLVTDATITTVPLPASLRGTDIAFDGAVYQIVGHNDTGSIHMLALDEDGVLGDDHVITPTVDPNSAKLDIVSDGAGSIIVFHSDSVGTSASKATSAGAVEWTTAVPKYGLGSPVWLESSVWIPDTTPILLSPNGTITRPRFAMYADYLLAGADVLLGGTVMDLEDPHARTDAYAGRRRMVTRFDPATGAETATGATYVDAAIAIGDRIVVFEKGEHPAVLFALVYSVDGTQLTGQTLAMGPPPTYVRECPSDSDDSD
jgi:hypothetical protein